GATSMTWLDDVKGNWTQGSLTVTAPPVITALSAILPSGLGLIDFLRISLDTTKVFRPLFPPAPGIFQVPAFGAIGPEIPEDIGDPNNPADPTGILSKAPQALVNPGARGTYLEALVTSALLAPNETPPRPGQPPAAGTLAPP